VLFLLIAVRILVNPLSNVFQKRLTHRSADPLFLMTATYGFLALLSLPVLFVLPLPSGRAFWFSLAILSVLDVAGNVALVAALERADLSILGPLNSFKAVISLVFGVIVLKELPTLPAILGVLLIGAGGFFLSGGHAARGAGSGIRLRILSLVILALAAVYLKRCILLSSPLTTFALWAAGAFPVSLVAVWLMRRASWRQLRMFREAPRDYASLVFTFGLAQLCVVFTFRVLPVSVSLALFQISTLLAVWFGRHFFREQGIPRRLAASVVMIAGAILASSAAF